MTDTPSDEGHPTPALDEAGDEREGEQLDKSAMAAWLSAEGLRTDNNPVTVRQFKGGYSNLTYLVEVGDAAYVFRRPPFGNTVRGGHDMTREVRVLKALEGAFQEAPRVVASAEELPALGGACYLMERVRGVIIRRRLPRGILATEDTMRRLSKSMIDTLARLHDVDVSQAPLASLGRPEGYAERQVVGWTERYARARTDDLKGMERMAQFLAERLPPSSALPPSLVHNDFKYDNLVLNPDDIGEVRAVLDWEMATIGDPLMDLGTTLGYWVEAGDPPPIQALAFGPTAKPGSLTRAELVARYAAARGASIADPVFYYVFGIFKIAVIIQQIYARFVRGTTKDARFASLGAVVAVLAAHGDIVCDRDRLSPPSG